MKRFTRGVTVGLSAATALAATGLVVVPSAAAAVSCSVNYAVASQWSGGFVANVTLNNAGDALNGWTLTWTYPGDQRVTSAWNARVSQNGSQVSASNESFNGGVPTGGSASFGFQGTVGETNGAPSSFAVNGVSCGGGTPSTTSTSSTTPVTTRPSTSTWTPPSTSTWTPPSTSTWTPPTTSSSTPPTQSGCGAGTPQAEVTASGGSYTARRGGSVVYSGGNFQEAVQTAISRLSSGRSSNERVVVRGDASMPASSRISLASYTTLEVCGTINVTGTASGDMAPVYARGVRNVAVPYLKLTGSPNYGIFMRSVDNIHLGQIDMRLSRGLGIRIDNHANRAVKSRNVRIDNVYVSVPDQGVETYGVDGLTVGTVVARNVGYAGLLLNDTINATVGTVDAENVGSGTGYAAFRMANRNGRVGSSYPTNIRIGTVKARGGGRGIFCVSESGGAVIDRVEISGTGNNAILIENCYNVNIAAIAGSVSGGGEIRLAARSEFTGNRDITIQNLTVTNNRITESPCGTNTVIRNNRGATLNVCSGSVR